MSTKSAFDINHQALIDKIATYDQREKKLLLARDAERPRCGVLLARKNDAPGTPNGQKRAAALGKNLRYKERKLAIFKLELDALDADRQAARGRMEELARRIVEADEDLRASQVEVP